MSLFDSRFFALLLVGGILCGGAMRVDETPRFLDIRIRPCFGRQTLVLDDSSYQTAQGDRVTISRFRFYLTNLKLRMADGSLYTVPNGSYLIDAEDTASLHLRVPRPPRAITAVEGLIGVDSATNLAGAGGGAFDASRGMYWAWHSGYIHAKLEGSCVRCRTRGHRFELHVGGFKRPYATQRAVVLPVKTASLRLRADALALLSGFSLSDTCTVVEPGALAARVAQGFDRILVADED